MHIKNTKIRGKSGVVFYSTIPVSAKMKARAEQHLSRIEGPAGRYYTYSLDNWTDFLKGMFNG